MKKHLLSVACALAFLPVLGLAQTPPNTDQLKPYLQVKTVPGEEGQVRVFFSPSCPYSKQYFHFFKNLGATLPAEKKFSLTPLVNKVDGIEYALSFAVVKKYYPAFINNFVEASLIGVQDKNISTKNWLGIDRIGKAAGIPVPISKLVLDHKSDSQVEVENIIFLQKKLAISNTPAVAVAGTYIVTPEFTNGDTALFSQLVNGIISMAQ